MSSSSFRSSDDSSAVRGPDSPSEKNSTCQFAVLGIWYLCQPTLGGTSESLDVVCDATAIRLGGFTRRQHVGGGLMSIYVSSGWDLLLLFWGLVWIVATALFLLGVNSIFQREEHQTEATPADREAS